jgi:class 3 adenylate cyclase
MSKQRAIANLPRLGTPDVSLITSWYVHHHREDSREVPAGLRLALGEGVDRFDLYFLGENEIPWYARVARTADGTLADPQAFAAQLTRAQIDLIADALQRELPQHYRGPMVGRTPRIVALATFFPDLSLPSDSGIPEVDAAREEAIAALRSALYLAYRLGCFCVECVGGSGVPLGPLLETEGSTSVSDYRTRCTASLAASLVHLCDSSRPSDGQKSPLPDSVHLPFLAFELEPGESFLLNSLDSYRALRDSVAEQKGPGAALASSIVRLNVDVAHAMLLGYSLFQLRTHNLVGQIAHMHISDQAGDTGHGGHANDLPPGALHRFDSFVPWLNLANERALDPEGFSGSIAVELEACKDLSAVLTSIGVTRRWLRLACERQLRACSAEDLATYRQELKRKELSRSYLLAVDVGNSTAVLQRVDALQPLIEEMCRRVLKHGGAVMSYTGDGLIAAFEERRHRDGKELALTLLETAKDLCKALAKEYRQGDQGAKGATVRAAVHWSEQGVRVPASGPLSGQVMGPDVVCVTRLCDWVKENPERGTPPKKRARTPGVVAASEHYIQRLTEFVGRTEVDRYWADWGRHELRGLGEIGVFALERWS